MGTKSGRIPLWWEGDQRLCWEMQCAEKSQKPWLDLGEEVMTVQLDGVTHGRSEVVGIRVECFVW